MSDSLLSDIDFKNKMAWVWTTLNDVNLTYENNLLKILEIPQIQFFLVGLKQLFLTLEQSLVP